MARTITLNDEEWRLVVELLENERNELPAEIHHTDTTEYRAQLSQRLETVSQLLDALRKQ